MFEQQPLSQFKVVPPRGPVPSPAPFKIDGAGIPGPAPGPVPRPAKGRRFGGFGTEVIKTPKNVPPASPALSQDCCTCISELEIAYLG